MTAHDSVSAWALIDRPIMDVFRYVADASRLPEWVPFYSSVKVTEVDPKTGEVKAFEAAFSLWAMGFITRIEIIDFVPGRRICYRTLSPPQLATYEFEPSSKGTLVTASHAAWLGTAVGPWVSMMRPFAADLLNQALLSLQRQVEGRSPVSQYLIFVSYRRREDRYVGGRIDEALSQEFGRGTVFRDVEDIPPGNPWDAEISQSLASSKVVIVLIGPNWVKELHRRRRFRNKKIDQVVRELATAFRLRKKVIPLLIDGATAPLEKELPAEIAALPWCQFHALRPDPDFTHDMNRVILSIWLELMRPHAGAQAPGGPSVRGASPG